MEFCICLLKNIKQINPNKTIVRFCVMPIGKALFRRRFQKEKKRRLPRPHVLKNRTEKDRRKSACIMPIYINVRKPAAKGGQKPHNMQWCYTVLAIWRCAMFYSNTIM